MKTKSFKYIGIVLAVLLSFATGPVQGQEPEPPGEDPAGTEYVLAQPPYTMNYQGYLTDSGGTPLNGTYDLAFQLWDDVSGGTMEWGTEVHNSTQVTNGLFQVTLGSSVTLYPHVFDEALFLAVRVNGTWVTPRQPLHAVPYAFGLVPGAEVQGDPDGTSYGLYVSNTGTGSTDTGLIATGAQYGIYAAELGPGDVGIYSEDFVHARGYKSDEASYLWIPPQGAVLYSGHTANCTLYQGLTYVRLGCNSPGTKEIFLPVTMPGELLGQEVRVEQMTVYYKTQNAATYIHFTKLAKATGLDSWEDLINDPTNRDSTSATDYSIDASGNYTLTRTSGSLCAYLQIIHDGSTAHDIYIGMIRLRLGHTD